MTVDPYSSVLWLDGQEVDTDLLNNGQRYIQAQITDQIIQHVIGGVANTGITDPTIGGENGANAPTLWAYALSPGSAYLRKGGANNKIQMAPGTLLQKVSNSDGLGSTLIPYTFTGTEEWPTIASGGTSFRIDLLQMKLEYVNDTGDSLDFEDAVTRAKTTLVAAATRRRVQCTLTVKSSTPAASPTIPDPDSGFVPVGMAVVGANWSSVTPMGFGSDCGIDSEAAVIDLRMPVTTRAVRTEAALFRLQTAWALSSSNQIAVSSSATNDMVVPCQMETGRLIGLFIEGTSMSVNPVIGQAGNGLASTPSSSFVRGNTLTAPGMLFNGPASRFYRSDFEDTHNPSLGPVIKQSAVNKIGVPLWASGFRTAQRDTSANLDAPLGIRFQNQASGQQIGGITFLLATGL